MPRLFLGLAAAILMATPALAQDPTPFFQERCGALFQKGPPAYKRSQSEMPVLMMFTLGWYSAAGEDTGDWVTQIANRKDVIPALYQRCLNRPDESFADALSETVPGPATQVPDARRMMFDAPCGDLFGPPPKRFKRQASDFELLLNFSLGYWGARGAAPPASPEERLPLMNALYERCMETPEAPLLDALRDTVPAG